MIEAIMLGSGGGMPMPDRFLSSLLIKYKGRKILFDCGEGTQVALRKVNAGFKSIDIICISHVHGDHIFGLPGLLSTMGNSGRILPVNILGPLGITKIIDNLVSTMNSLPFELNVIENPTSNIVFLNTSDGLKMAKSCSDYKEIILNTVTLDHSTPCIGYSIYFSRQRKFDLEKALENQVPKELWNKLQKGESIVFEDRLYEPDMVLGSDRNGLKISFITDTRPLDKIADFINNSDLFICEGTYGNCDDIDKAISNKHMTFNEAALLAKNGNVKELLLTHFSTALGNPHQYLNNAKEIFENVTIAYDGLSQNLTYSE
jgi:ribonuclease Z